MRKHNLCSFAASSILTVALSFSPRAAMAQASAFPTLLQGTPVMLLLDQTVDGTTSRIGQRVSFVVSGDVTIGDRTIIPAGSFAMGTVTQASRRGRLVGAGRVSIDIDVVQLPGGQVVPLCTTPDLEDNGAGTTDDAIATNLVPPPRGVHLFSRHPKDAVIPEGTVVRAFVRRNTVVVRQTASVSN